MLICLFSSLVVALNVLSWSTSSSGEVFLYSMLISFPFLCRSNPSTPSSDWLLISLYNITLESKVKVMRIKEMIINLRSEEAPDCYTKSLCLYHRNFKDINTDVGA